MEQYRFYQDKVQQIHGLGGVGLSYDKLFRFTKRINSWQKFPVHNQAT